MSEYITEEGKINDVNTVKAQADQTPEACSCACIQDLHNYVLTVDFINALQNIRTMINDALINTDLSEIYKKLLLEIRTKLTDVWKHVGLIEDESNTQSAVKQKLLSLPQSELRQGDTRVLTYAKTIEGETSPRQVNDLYVYLGQASGPDAIDEATETSEHISKKWVKILTTEFNADDDEDINLDDIIRRLKAMEDRIGEAIRIVTSIWAYLCKNWWEFVDTADTVQEIKSKVNPVIAQNYYCKSDNNIYIYLRTGGTLDEPIMSWVPILNANNIPSSSGVWRHTEVVNTNWDPTTATAGEFFGQTVYRMGTFNGNGESTSRSNPAYGTIFVWLPTMNNGSGDIGSSAKWVPLTNENTIPQSWRHTKVVSAKPNEGSGTNGAGSFFGETRYSTVQEEKSEYNGDIYVWLPSSTGGTGGVGTNPKWFNITRNQAINNIKNYNPEYVQIYISPKQCSARLASACDPDNGVLTLNYTKIERYGQMVNLNLGYARNGSKLLESYNKENGNGHGSSYGKVNHEGWDALYDAYTKYVFFNRACGDMMKNQNAHTHPENAWTGIDDPNYIDNFTFIDMSKLFLGYYSIDDALPTKLLIDGVDCTERTSGKQKIEELLEKYNIPNTKPGYIELARRFFAPSETIEYTCYCEGWPGEAVENWRNECYSASGEAKVTAIYNVGRYLDPDVTTNNNRGMYRHLEDDNYRLGSVTGNIVANRTSDVACSSQNRIRPNGIIDAPLIPVNFISWGSHMGFRPYFNRVQGSHVGRSMSTVIDQSAFL